MDYFYILKSRILVYKYIIVFRQENLSLNEPISLRINKVEGWSWVRDRIGVRNDEAFVIEKWNFWF